MKTHCNVFGSGEMCKLATEKWHRELGNSHLRQAQVSYRELWICSCAGDLQLLDGRWYVTHSGLLRLAARRGCRGIQMLQDPSAPISQQVGGSSKRWFIRVASRRALSAMATPILQTFLPWYEAPSCALPKLAPSIAPCARPMGSAFAPWKSWVRSRARRDPPRFPHRPTVIPSNGNGNGQPRLRDQLCLLIRQYNLDANLVKAYAADFCGTATLSGASRELVESFISHLAVTAKENRDALVCKLNSYAQPTVEARS